MSAMWLLLLTIFLGDTALTQLHGVYRTEHDCVMAAMAVHQPYLAHLDFACVVLGAME